MFELIKNIVDFYSIVIITMFIVYIINLLYFLLKDKNISLIKKKKINEYYNNFEKYNENYNKNLEIFNKIIQNNELYYNYF